MLHLINKSPGQNHSLIYCLQSIKPVDVILFLEDGVYNLIKTAKIAKQIQQLPNTIRCLALENDVQGRDILANIIQYVELIDYAGFVDLTVQYHPIQTWL